MKIKLIIKIIKIMTVCAIAFIVLHLTPEFAIRRSKLYNPIFAFSSLAHFDENPSFVHIMPDSYEGKGMLFSVSQKYFSGESYFLVKKVRFLYFAKYVGGA